jgi:XTP/dITP diphosphohydrolase
MPALYVATTNPGKLRDFAVAAESHRVTILPLPGMEDVAPAPEEQATFEGNARQKALFYCRLAPGEIVLADDSGLEVGFLNGAPGVRSARYAADAGFSPGIGINDAGFGPGIGINDAGFGPGIGINSDTRNNLYLLQQLDGVAEADRAARYCCVLAAARDCEILLTGEGSVPGRILTAPRGSGGFGYDPLFYLPDLGRTMAEINLETKHLVSHRGIALRSFLTRFVARFG